MNEKLTAIKERYRQNQVISVLTCYDYPTALALDSAGIDIIFIGDSVGSNVLGYESVNSVTVDDMVHHTAAVRRGVKKGLVLSDMPYQSYTTPELALTNAKRLCNAGAEMIKLEGGSEVTPVVKALKAASIPVMSHIGYTPQSADGSNIVVGAKADEALTLYRDALALEAAGADMVVLECIPEKVTQVITEKLSIPTIGIGSGRYCSGQVLVITDVLGWHHHPYRILKQYTNFKSEAEQAARDYIQDLKSGGFPSDENIFRLKAEEFSAFTELIKSFPPSK